MPTATVTIVRVQSPDQFRPVAPALTALFRDFLRRSGEPFSLEMQWAAVLRVLAGGEQTLCLLALTGLTPFGYLLAQTGFDYWGLKHATVNQCYVAPGHAGLLRRLDDQVTRWALAQGCDILSGMTSRSVRAAKKTFGMVPIAVMLVRPLRGERDGQGYR